ncbi:MAG: hypothetical protein HRT44_13935, partial [Bdellovibrionales bacterium]|nr:hypothetical protein [Bdellovibrionales bacterium]
RPVDQVISEIDKVTPESVHEYIKEKYKPEDLSLFVLGPEDESLRKFIKNF